MVFGRYDFANFFCFGSYAACSVAVPVVLVSLAQDLNFPLAEGGKGAGGALRGAIFMATDYSTSPMTVRGGVIFGVGIGAITMCIRLWGAYPEGMSFAILIMNAVVPLINKYVKPKRFGVK